MIVHAKALNVFTRADTLMTLMFCFLLVALTFGLALRAAKMPDSPGSFAKGGVAKGRLP